MDVTRPSQPAQEPTVASPCVDVCKMSATTGLCEGCLRTIDEIAGWSTMTVTAKREVLERVRDRRA
ncbi:MAG: DUF1289 domain-containing protein [Betaproteobacteria bacterium]|nr:DUF1289 domain-containing protein [Betaproteobacteria bacterium]